MMFSLLWQEQKDFAPMIVQDIYEMRTVFELIKSVKAESYLEIGACYGVSAYIFSHALQQKSNITVVDLCEEKSEQYLYENIERIRRRGKTVDLIKGDSRDVRVSGDFDVVFIDGNHHYEFVKSDWERFAPKAKKLLLMHDIKMEGPGKTFEEAGGGLRIMGETPSMGYGVQMRGNEL